MGVIKYTTLVKSQGDNKFMVKIISIKTLINSVFVLFEGSFCFLIFALKG